MKTLKFFKKNINRDKVYASVEGYQLDLRPVVEKAKQLHGNHDELPSWAKLVANPKKGKGWYITLMEAMFNGKHNLYGVDVERLVDSTNSELSKRRVAMMFFPDNTKVDNLDEIGKITQNILSGWSVVVLSGNTVINGGHCESKVDDIIKSTNNNVLIISAKMAQRSFSEELIDELYLAYDKGQDGATIQKMSRALTSNSLNKVSRIFSLSFDPNRDDKLDTMVFQAALNQVEKKGKSDIREELKRVYNSIDIFSCNDKGVAIKLTVDEYVKLALEKKGISRVMGKKSDLTLLTKSQVQALLNGNVDYLRNDMKERAEMGKTKDSKPKMSEIVKVDRPSELDIEKLREVIITILENFDYLMNAGKNKGVKNVTEMFTVFENNKWEKLVEKKFNVPYDVIKYMVTVGVIKKEWVNLLHG
jgi:hypothetical protein